MCKMLLSINPEYVEMIFSGIKKYEFRKSQCKRHIDGIIIYCTSPVMKVVGEVAVTSILVDEPDKIWQTVKNEAGITRKFYNQYYSGRRNAVAYHLGNIEQYKEPKELKDFGISHAPQSFVYI